MHIVKKDIEMQKESHIKGTFADAVQKNRNRRKHQSLSTYVLSKDSHNT